MVEFSNLPLPQKASIGVTYLYDEDQEVFRAAAAGDFGGSATGQYAGATFPTAPLPHKAAPTILYLWDGALEQFRAAIPTDFLGSNAVAPSDLGTETGNVVIDFTSGKIQEVTWSGAITDVSFNVSDESKEASLTYIVYSDGNAPTWNTGITTFVDDTAPTLTSGKWNRLQIVGQEGYYHLGKAGEWA